MLRRSISWVPSCFNSLWFLIYLFFLSYGCHIRLLFFLLLLVVYKRPSFFPILWIVLWLCSSFWSFFANLFVGWSNGWWTWTWIFIWTETQIYLGFYLKLQRSKTYRYLSSWPVHPFVHASPIESALTVIDHFSILALVPSFILRHRFLGGARARQSGAPVIPYFLVQYYRVGGFKSLRS